MGEGRIFKQQVSHFSFYFNQLNNEVGVELLNQAKGRRKQNHLKTPILDLIAYNKTLSRSASWFSNS